VSKKELIMDNEGGEEDERKNWGRSSMLGDRTGKKRRKVFLATKMVE